MYRSGLRGILGRLRPRMGLGRALGRLVGWRPLLDLPECLEKPAGTCVLVIAPHPDDETLGCGGTLHKHHLAGDRITAVFLTDGARGDNVSQGIAGQELVELREAEARGAAKALGVAECIFLRNRDGSLECSPQTAGQVLRLLELLRPDIVYVPSPYESHRDHRTACAITARALSDYPRPLKVYLYEIWAPVPANCAVPINLERKFEAVRFYRSQMDARELYVLLASSLARYRGITCLPGQDAAVECFLRLDRTAFIELARGLE